MDKMSKEDKPFSSTILPSPSGWLSNMENKPTDDKVFPAANLTVFPEPVKTRAQDHITKIEHFSGSLELVPMEIDSEDDKGWLSNMENKPTDDKVFPAANLTVFPEPVKTRAQDHITKIEHFSGSLELVPMEIDSEDDKGLPRSACSEEPMEEPMEVDPKLPIEMEIASLKMNRHGACGGASHEPRRKNYQSKEEVRKLKDLSSSSTSQEDHGFKTKHEWCKQQFPAAACPTD